MRRAFLIPEIAFALALAGPARAVPVSEPDVVFACPDQIELKLDFVRPEGAGLFPLVVCIHGGGWAIGSRAEYHGMQNQLAGMGIASAAVEYRFAPTHRFPAQLDDVVAALRFLADHRTRFRVDPDRIGLIGGSAGGHLALLAGLSEIKGCKIKAVVNVSGPTDLRTYAATPAGDAILKAGVKRDSAELLADLLGSGDRKDPIYARASPVVHVRKDGPPVLTVHGSADDLVPFSQALSLQAALKNAGEPERLIKIDGGNHFPNFWPKEAHAAADRAVFSFFKDQLKPEAAE